MNTFRILTLFFVAALAFAYYLFVDFGQFRLPKYYTPDGQVIRAGESHGQSINHFYEIDGLDPTKSSILFESPDPIIVSTDVGVSLMRKIPNSPLKVLIDFKVLIFYSFLFLVCGFWFLRFGNDVHLASFCFSATFFFFSTIVGITYHNLTLASQISGFVYLVTLFNASLRTTGKEAPGYLLIGEVLLIIFLSLVAYVGIGSAGTFKKLLTVTVILYYISVLSALGLMADNALRAASDSIDKIKRWTLFVGTAVGGVLPLLLFQIHVPWFGDPFLIPGIFGLVFPLSLLYGTYRIHLVPFQFVLTRSILAAVLTLVFVLIYGAVLMAHSLLLPERDPADQWVVHIIFILILVFFLDPAKRRISHILEARFFRLNTNLSESLKRIALTLSSSFKIQNTIHAYLAELESTLGLEKVHLLFGNESFPELKVRSGEIMRISDKSSVWKYLAPEKFVVTSYLTYGAGERGELYRFLLRQNIALAIGISGGSYSFWRMLGIRSRSKKSDDATKVALLLGDTKEKRFLLSEIRYLQEAARLAGLLVHNYSLLAQEVDKRRRMRELYVAGMLQRNISHPFRSQKLPGISLDYISAPAMEVTGDYLDAIRLPDHKVAFFLGDVSGHGLGTGYLVSAVRSIARSHLQQKAGLGETFETLNEFLMDRYGGNEFVTLFAMILDTHSGLMEYLNAAHPGPIIFRAKDRGFIRLDETQRLLGVIENPYSSKTMQLYPGDRVFLFSDGISEAFNEADQPFTEERVEEIVMQIAHKPLGEIIQDIQKTLKNYRGSRSISDDTTFLALEFTGKPSPKGILGFFGIEES